MRTIRLNNPDLPRYLWRTIHVSVALMFAAVLALELYGFITRTFVEPLQVIEGNR